MADFLLIDDLPVRLAIEGGIDSHIDNFNDRDRNIAGGLLVTRSIGGDKETLSCRTVPYTDAERDALLTKLRSASFLPISGEAMDAPRSCAAEVRAVTPITLKEGRFFIIAFDLIQD